MDLFSGPGGLAEGFAGFRSPRGRRRFSIALSVEKDRDAHRTLRLRAFLRRFGSSLPREYYDFLNGVVAKEPDWGALHPNEWAEACGETRCLELGTPGASAFLRRGIEAIRDQHGGRTVLLGGPPCQSYSVIGRSRNAGNRRYNADQDDRQSLYEQYAKVLARLRPAVAVLENVKGMPVRPEKPQADLSGDHAQSPRCGWEKRLQAVLIGFSRQNLLVGRRAGTTRFPRACRGSRRTADPPSRLCHLCPRRPRGDASRLLPAVPRTRARHGFSQGHHRRDAEAPQSSQPGRCS